HFSCGLRTAALFLYSLVFGLDLRHIVFQGTCMTDLLSWFVANTTSGWLVLGAILIAAEVFLVPGIGFLFAGLGAVTLGGLLAFSVIAAPSLTAQVAYFLALGVAWA